MRERVLFCAHNIDNGGAAKSLYILLKYLPETFSAAILSLRDPAPDSFYLKFYREHRIPVFVFPFGWLPISYINCPINIEAQKRRMEEMRPFVEQARWIGGAAQRICFNGYPACSLAPYFDAQIPQTLIAREQLRMGPEYSKITRFIGAYIKKAIAIGSMEAKQLTNMGIANKIVFNSAEHEPEYFPPPAIPPLVFAVFTRFGPDKGLDTLLLAIKAIKEKLLANSAIIRIYGARGIQSFGQEEQIEAFIRTGNLNDVIKIEPWVNDVESAIKQACCIVRPDKSGSPWGRDIIEAMSLGRPVLATGSLDIFVRENKTGWLVPPDNPQALADKLAFLAENPELLQKAGLEALCFAKENFNPQVNASRVAEYLFQ